MSDIADTPEKADSESRCSTPQAASVASLDLDDSSKLGSRNRTRSSRSTTPVTKALRPRLKVSESPNSSHDGKFDDDDDDPMDEGPLVEKRKHAMEGELIHDPYCWICHKELVDGNSKPCYTCLRSLHPKCAPAIKFPNMQSNPDHWECPECSPFSYEPKPRSEGSQEQLDVLFKYVIDRAATQATEPFLNPVDLKEFPQYLDYIVHPICITEIEEKLNKSLYLSPRELLADFKWIHHNSIIFNSAQAKLTSIAKQMLRVVREETKEIENCPNCLYNAYTMKPDWFIQACDRPHLLVWAKMKGFPYWPAKAMAFNQAQTLVDVRFFGKHDRAHLPIVDCMLYTSWYPAPAQVKKPREDVAACIKEVDQHIAKLKQKFGTFVYASTITFLNPKDMEGQVKKMLPNYKPDTMGKQIPAASEVAKGATENSKKIELASNLTPNVVLTRLSEVDKHALKCPTATAAVVEDKIKIEKSPNNSRKNSTEGDESQDLMSNSVRAKTPSAIVNKAAPSLTQLNRKSDGSETMLKRKLPQTTNKGVPELAKRSTKGSIMDVALSSDSERESKNSKKGSVNSLAKELEALGSDLSDSDDEIENFVEQEIKEIPAKKSKIETIDDDDAEMLMLEAQDFEISKNEKAARPQSPMKVKPGGSNVDQQKQKKIADGIKVLNSLKVQGLDVTQLPSGNSSPMSQSFADMSSDSSEFLESDIEMEKDVIHSHEPIIEMQVEPDLSIEYEKKAPVKRAPLKSVTKSPLKNFTKFFPKNALSSSHKSLLKSAPVKRPAIPIATAPSNEHPASSPKTAAQQSLLKSSLMLMPNKARKTLPSASLLSQRLTVPKKTPPKKFIISSTPVSNTVQDDANDSKADGAVLTDLPNKAGPSTAKLNVTAENLADHMKQTIYSLINDLVSTSGEDLKTENANLKLQLEAERWFHRSTVDELKKNQDSVMQEFDMLIEESNLRAKIEAQRVAEYELKQTINEVKRKTWCSVCLIEASLYCCWNTSYCSFHCQKRHWPDHKNMCKSKLNTGAGNLPKNIESINSATNGLPPSKPLLHSVPSSTVASTNGSVTMTKTLKKSVPTSLASHTIIGTASSLNMSQAGEISAGIPQLIAVAPTSTSLIDQSEPGMRTATHFLMTPAMSNVQVKLPAGIHHTTLPPLITTRPVQTVAKSSSTQQVTATPLFQFYKESTE
ncbi:MYND-type zinc finger-containing chromatin reader ZMYND8-like [Neocloeon triangulifer]|uniref:MYND-type zinc finger-containing chromatin reader ZMYND8-like n=1 Tax=Neocloeon triangulifer TaxID=2078957 RepID=UPI00286EE62C|nr:MYND-type zinc finger-containing chromatin reader ZMYND8-like [Neocloeon triangulifer]XP_059479036.1 MYND-type zinc finger-containing chromatin reader ZMYND8-like [Neocloeon triangulifer]XP_059479037.1 MYND-type zinc finger-containing chromatin reader ZMYND8-like [Neocloeon triangulifer]